MIRLLQYRQDGEHRSSGGMGNSSEYQVFRRHKKILMKKVYKTNLMVKGINRRTCGSSAKRVLVPAADLNGTNPPLLPGSRQTVYAKSHCGGKRRTSSMVSYLRIIAVDAVT